MPWKPAAGGGSTRRPRTGSRSIRGHISGPIPIPDPLDDEFPIRDQPLTTINVAEAPRLVTNDADTVPRRTTHDLVGTRYASDSSGSTGDDNFRCQTPDIASSAAAHTSTSQRSSTKVPSQFRHSNPVSDAGSRGDERNSEGQPQRKKKKSSIRSTLSKLFGRKNKSQPNKDDEPQLPSGETTSTKSTGAPNTQHRSDPTGQRPPAIVIEPKRSFSMPITEYDRALRSHSIGPEDVMAIQSARNSLSADARLSGKCMSLFDSPAHPASPRRAGGSKLAGLSPRPASSQDRTRLAGSNEDPSEIGRAISSDSRGVKRRSRSLTFTPSLDLAPPSAPRDVIRRRSAEIRYWRESYAAPHMSPTSTIADEESMQLPIQSTEMPKPEPEQQRAQLAQPQLQPEPELLPEPLSDSLPIVEERVVTPPQSALIYEAGEEGRHKPQHKSTARSTEDAGLVEPVIVENRVSILETRMSRLEGIVLQLGTSLSVLRQPNQETRPSGPRPVHVQTNNYAVDSMLLQASEMGFVGERRRSVSRPSTCRSDTSKMTFGDIGEVTPRATIISPTFSSSQQQRGAAEETMRHSAEGMTFEHYTNLLALLETERSTREALEAQVRSLGHQLHLISKSMAYTSTDQSDSPSLNRSLGEMSVFDHDDEDDHRRPTATRYPYNTLDLDDSGVATGNQSDDGYTESFVTPTDMVNRSFDAFGNESESEMLSDSTKLSLSHLNMRQPLAEIPPVAAHAM
ncbi:hypothetical protein C2857_005876 [Epichloe festucae Fl1]|uniref:Uncharacterized protein n=1 Tax=Epichloe festucae (strain Fl1) TaxID=877507 RepID=A0A7S9PVX4_EPIFF|nr:hypothetical protein C2857_005876 [Epichloe festucae Fl1]